MNPRGRVSFAYGLFTGAVLVWAWLAVHFSDYDRDPSKASLFLRSYSPEKIFGDFQLPMSSMRISGETSGGGRDSVMNGRNYDADFTICRGREQAFNAAITRDLLDQLKVHNARILRQQKDSRGTFHLVYRLGTSLGTITLPALFPARLQRVMPLPDQLEDVQSEMTIDERWYPSEVAVSRASFP